ncbi:hypothetical protein IAT38_006252 [Cryptococcus sp. DSM 104549]
MAQPTPPRAPVQAPHPLATPSHPSLSRRLTSNSPGGTSLRSPAPSVVSEFGAHASTSHAATHHTRPHAATISTTRPAHKMTGGASEADLLGVGSSLRLRRAPVGAPTTAASQRSPTTSTRSTPDPDDPSFPAYRPSPKRGESADSRGLGKYLDSLGREELEVVETRFDLMSDEELGAYLRPFTGAPREEEVSPSTGPEPPTPRVGDHTLPPSSASSPPPKTPPDDRPPTSPLFPPSPPSFFDKKDVVEHPMKVLSRAVREMREVIGRLEEENERLRAGAAGPAEAAGSALGVGMGSVGSGRKGPDQMSIHDGLADAISTSLTSTSSIPHPSNALHIPDPTSPTPSIFRSARHRSIASSASVPFPSTPRDPSQASQTQALEPPSAAAPSRASRQSWASGLWVWNAKKPPRVRKNSSGSVASVSASASASASASQSQSQLQSAAGSTPGLPANGGGWGGLGGVGGVQSAVVGDEEDEEAWRRGDGGSSPGFRAVFLATRIITPDPSSILVSPEIPPNSLIAYLAHSLVSNARDEGIVVRDSALRRRSRDLSRGRAMSVASQEVGMDIGASDGTGSAGGGKGGGGGSRDGARGYGDTALAATASLGRSLLSSMTNATMRGSKSASSPVAGSNSGAGDDSRPSLLSRVSSSRGFPTTAISPPPSLSQPATSAHNAHAQDGAPLPSVELSSIVPDESRPPTVLLSRQNLGSFFQSSKIGRGKMTTASRFEGAEPPLTDRYGFIYDIQHAKMLKDASVAGTAAPMSLTGVVPKSEEPEEGWIAKRRRGSQGSHTLESRATKPPADAKDKDASHPSSPRLSLDIDTGSNSSTLSPRRAATPDSITTPPETRTSHAEHHRHRSTTLLSLNPSPARPVTAKDHLTVSARGAGSLQSGVTEGEGEGVGKVPLSASLAHSHSNMTSLGGAPTPGVGNGSSTVSAAAAASRVTISSLLDQLTDLHDRQQTSRLLAWDSFIKKREKSRANRASAAASERGRRNDGMEDMRWTAELVGLGQMGGGKGGEDWKVFARLVRGGVPLKYRGDVWAECSGAKDLMVPGEYKEILDVHKNDVSPVAADIEKDVSRTFPGNVFFGGDGPGVGKLRRVLVAYAWHNPAVGYCQGMNMLAATLLLTVTDEEQAFWVLTSMIDRLLPPNFFAPSLLGSRADQMVLAQIVAQILPKIDAHFQELGVDLASITFGWFLSLFTDCLPVETLFRVWDVFFVEGHDSIFRVAVAILKLNETEICNCESVSDLFSFISSMTSRLWGADKLISLQHSYKPIIRHIDIVARCEKAVEVLSEELGDA